MLSVAALPKSMRKRSRTWRKPSAGRNVTGAMLSLAQELRTVTLTAALLQTTAISIATDGVLPRSPWVTAFSTSGMRINDGKVAAAHAGLTARRHRTRDGKRAC